MQIMIWKAVAAGAIALAGAGALSAQQDPPAAGELKVFATQYVAAINSKDSAKLLALQNPKALACMTGDKKDYYDFVLFNSLQDKIPANYTTSVGPVNESNLKALESMGGQFPIPPVKELHIDYQQGDDAGQEIVYLVQQNGHWLGDFPCITDAAVMQFRDGRAAREAAMAHYKELADGIKEPLRSELIGLLRAHKTGSATDRYHAASGQDVGTSMLVMDQLKAEAR